MSHQHSDIEHDHPHARQFERKRRLLVSDLAVRRMEFGGDAAGLPSDTSIASSGERWNLTMIMVAQACKPRGLQRRLVEA
eukprot:294823-Rhodomonas_salina.2